MLASQASLVLSPAATLPKQSRGPRVSAAAASHAQPATVGRELAFTSAQSQRGVVVGGSASRRSNASRRSVSVCNSASYVASAASSSSAGGPLGSIREKIAEKVKADPNFLFKLFVEILIDEVITIVVNVLTRGSPATWSGAVWAQVLCQVFVAMFNDIALVWALAPEKDGKIAHCFQEGKFTLANRVGCWFDKWKLYTVIGFFTGLLSMVATGVISADAKLLSRLNLTKAACTGAFHLGISANTRYQIVNGIEVLLYKYLPQEAGRIGSAVVRMGNNFAGARLWMLAAAFVGGFFPAV